MIHENTISSNLIYICFIVIPVISIHLLLGGVNIYQDNFVSENDYAQKEEESSKADL